MSCVNFSLPPQTRFASLPPFRAWEAGPARVGLAILALLPVLALACLLDPRTLAGVSVWDKPMRFSMALGIYLLSLGFYAAFISPPARARRAYRWPMLIGTASAALEMMIITLQSARGIGSHFNFATSFDSAAYGLMGIGALLLTAMMAIVAVGIARYPAATAPNGAVRLSVVWSLGLSCVLTLLTAGTIAILGGPQVGETDASRQALRLLGWFTQTGDLRVAHFFGTHAMHTVPLAVWILGLWHRVSTQTVARITLGYTVFVLLTYGQALLGEPLLPVAWGQVFSPGI